MTQDELNDEIEKNEGILFLQLNLSSCPMCGQFDKVVEETIKDKEYIKHFKCLMDDYPLLKIFPHTNYPVNYFFVKDQPYPFIRPGATDVKNLESEIFKFKKIMEGEDVQEVFQVYRNQ